MALADLVVLMRAGEASSRQGTPQATLFNSPEAPSSWPASWAATT